MAVVKSVVPWLNGQGVDRASPLDCIDQSFHVSGLQEKALPPLPTPHPHSLISCNWNTAEGSPRYYSTHLPHTPSISHYPFNIYIDYSGITRREFGSCIYSWKAKFSNLALTNLYPAMHNSTLNFDRLLHVS